ncbi:AMP-binding protein [Amycolatopsis sp. NPDC021455]|uniref:(2,3-dihydroxybenzoyl)adenylate synthase n=1 Tax=Amycolatopsis sp. NPDC021455 TaxID=3154901 RepID=UPI0033C3F3A6
MALPGFVPWPEEAARRYAETGCWRGRPLGDLLAEAAVTHGTRTALVDGDLRLGYRELAGRADRLAGRLAALGLRRGDAVLTQLPNSAEHVTFLFACLRLGVLPVQALPAHREHELAHLAELADVRAVATVDRFRGFDHQELAARVAGKRPDPCPVLVFGDDVAPEHADLRRAPDGPLPTGGPRPGDVALFLLSGGSTGLPKLIARTHDDYAYNVLQSARVCGFGPGTVYLAALPMAHNFALGCPGVLGTLAVGGRVVLAPSPQPERAFELIERERVTVTALVPAVLSRWLDHAGPAGPPALDCVQVGGSVLPPALAEEAMARLGPLQQVFGMAEGLINCTRPGDPPEVLTRTQGRPISPYDETKIVDARGNPVADGDAGELLTRGPYTIRGYFNAPAHNARSFTRDGWYRTGDLVRRHPSGNFVVEGRIKDVINRGGEKIAAEEVESLVRALPAVREVSAIAVPDPDLGERVCVCVVLEPGATLDLGDVRAAFARRDTARFKMPERLEIFGAFPRTPVGKTDKPALRALVAARAPATEKGEAHAV